ncbi:MAG TPA: TonB-dependent receptor [Gemmatimonadales bacterium]|nr:TonB-dependent receptor [Gemmatimonadales bacterium]
MVFKSVMSALAILLVRIPETGAQIQDSVVTGADSAAVRQLEAITVTAERPRSVAPPVTTLEVPAAELRRAIAANPYDLLRRTSGIEVHEQGQGPGFASDVVIRGFSSDHSSDVLLVLDGVPLNLPVHGHVEGYSDWSILSPAGVSSLRVITGPASPLYGDFSLAGVVEVFTASDASGTSGSIFGSSYGDAGGWLRSGNRSQNGGAMGALEGRRQQGWRDNSSYWLGNGLLRGWRSLGAGRLEGGLALYGSTWDSPGFVSVSRYNGNALTAAMDPTDGGSAYRGIAHGRFTMASGETGIEASAWLQRVHSGVFLTIPEDGALNQSDEQDRRTAVGGRFQLSRDLGGGDLSAGVDGRADFAGYDLYRTEQRNRVSPTRLYDARYFSGGAFLRWRTLVGTRIALDLGARADAVHYRSLNRLTGTSWRSNSNFVMSPKLGARYLAGGGWSILTSLSQGFRGPPGVVADPGLQPIRGWSKELGLRYDGTAVGAQLALFRLDVSHERIQDPVTREVLLTGKSLRQGINLDAEVRLSEWLTLKADGTINDAHVKGDPVSEVTPLLAPNLVTGPEGKPIRPSFHIEPLEPGDPVPNVASWLGRVGVEATLTRRLGAQGRVRFSGPCTPIGEPGIETSSYAVLDLGGSVQIGSAGTTLDLELQNVFDTKYPEIRASGFINPGSPRSLRAAIRFADQP